MNNYDGEIEDHKHSRSTWKEVACLSVARVVYFRSREANSRKRENLWLIIINGSGQQPLKSFVNSFKHANSTALSLVPISISLLGRAWPENDFRYVRTKCVSVVALETRRSLCDACNDVHCVTPVTTFTEAYNKVSRYYRYPSNLS